MSSTQQLRVFHGFLVQAAQQGVRSVAHTKEILSAIQHLTQPQSADMYNSEWDVHRFSAVIAAKIGETAQRQAAAGEASAALLFKTGMEFSLEALRLVPAPFNLSTATSRRAHGDETACFNSESDDGQGGSGEEELLQYLVNDDEITVRLSTTGRASIGVYDASSSEGAPIIGQLLCVAVFCACGFRNVTSKGAMANGQDERHGIESIDSDVVKCFNAARAFFASHRHYFPSTDDFFTRYTRLISSLCNCVHTSSSQKVISEAFVPLISAMRGFSTEAVTLQRLLKTAPSIALQFVAAATPVLNKGWQAVKRAVEERFKSTMAQLGETNLARVHAADNLRHYTQPLALTRGQLSVLFDIANVSDPRFEANLDAAFDDVSLAVHILSLFLFDSGLEAFELLRASPQSEALMPVMLNVVHQAAAAALAQDRLEIASRLLLFLQRCYAHSPPCQQGQEGGKGEDHQAEVFVLRCFTLHRWKGAEGLREAVQSASPHIRKCCSSLLTAMVAVLKAITPVGSGDANRGDELCRCATDVIRGCQAGGYSLEAIVATVMLGQLLFLEGPSGIPAAGALCRPIVWKFLFPSKCFVDQAQPECALPGDANQSSAAPLSMANPFTVHFVRQATSLLCAVLQQLGDFPNTRGYVLCPLLLATWSASAMSHEAVEEAIATMFLFACCAEGCAPSPPTVAADEDQPTSTSIGGSSSSRSVSFAHCRKKLSRLFPPLSGAPVGFTRRLVDHLRASLQDKGAAAAKWLRSAAKDSFQLRQQMVAMSRARCVQIVQLTAGAPVDPLRWLGAEYCCIDIALSKDDETLIIKRNENVDNSKWSSISVSVPLSLRVEGYNILSECKTEIDRILAAAKHHMALHMGSVEPSRSREEKRSEKVEWWAARKHFDTQLGKVVTTIDEQLLGPWRGLFLGSVTNLSQRRQLEQLAEEVVKRLKQIAAKGAGVSPQVVYLILNSVPFLSGTLCEKGNGLLRLPQDVANSQVLFRQNSATYLTGLSESDVVPEIVDKVRSLLAALVQECEVIDIAEDESDDSPDGCGESPLFGELSKVATWAVRCSLTIFKEHAQKCGGDQDLFDVPRQHVFLVLDKVLHGVPWECTVPLRIQSVSRIPNVPFLLQALRSTKRNIRRDKVFYVLNPRGDMGKTEERFATICQEERWRGLVRSFGGPGQVLSEMRRGDLYLYLGHGTGERAVHRSHLMDRALSAAPLPCVMLMSCSSAQMDVGRGYDPYGMPNAFLQAGSPMFVGCLWDVTDGEIDRVTRDTLLALFGGFSAEFDDKLKSMALSRGDLSGASQTLSPSPTHRQGASTLPVALSIARRQCRLKYLTGAAVIAYGVPVSPATSSNNLTRH